MIRVLVYLFELVHELCGFPVQREGVFALHVFHRFVELRDLRMVGFIPFVVLLALTIFG